MPTIHVVYDPRDRLTGVSPDAAKGLNLSQVVLRIDDGEIDPAKVAQLAEELAAMLLAEIVG